MSKLTLVLTALMSVGSIHAATILSENFNELTPQLAVTSAGVFTTTGGTNVDIVGGSVSGFLCVTPESGNCLDLDGSGGNDQGSITQSGSITLNPGVNYFLSYDLTGSQRGNTTSATVKFGPYSQTFSLASGDTSSGIVTNALINVSTVTTTSLTFTSNTPGALGSLLDNVLITSGASTVPEPSSIILVVPMLLGLVWLERRRRVRQS